jgi:hypothetical protein
LTTYRRAREIWREAEMGIRKNPDWSVWLADVWHWASRPPGVYVCIIVLLVGALAWSWSKPASYTSRPQVTTVLPPAVPLTPLNPPSTVWISPECDGVPTVYTYFSQTTYRINPNFCQLRGYVQSGCVSWLDTTRAVVGRTCQGGGMPGVPGITMLRAETEAVVRLNHCINMAPGNLVDTCR